jgi:hypothetical protein
MSVKQRVHDERGYAVVAIRRQFRRSYTAAIVGLLVVPMVTAGVFSSPSQFPGTVPLDNGGLCLAAWRQPPMDLRPDCPAKKDPWAGYLPRTAVASPAWSVIDPNTQRAIEELQAWKASGLLAQNDASNDFMSICATNTEDGGGGVGLCFRW